MMLVPVSWLRFLVTFQNGLYYLNPWFRKKKKKVLVCRHRESELINVTYREYSNELSSKKKNWRYCIGRVGKYVFLTRNDLIEWKKKKNVFNYLEIGTNKRHFCFLPTRKIHYRALTNRAASAWVPPIPFDGNAGDARRPRRGHLHGKLNDLLPPLKNTDPRVRINPNSDQKHRGFSPGTGSTRSRTRCQHVYNSTTPRRRFE